MRQSCCPVGFQTAVIADEYLALSAVIWLKSRDQLHHDPDPLHPLCGERAGDGGPGAAGQVLH